MNDIQNLNFGFIIFGKNFYYANGIFQRIRRNDY